MKRALCVALLTGLAGLGCMSLREGDKTPKAVLKEPPPVVTEHGITEKNAAEKAEALRRELEYDLAKKAPDAPAK
jgi:hypothetical protein